MALGNNGLCLNLFGNGDIISWSFLVSVWDLWPHSLARGFDVGLT